MAFGFTCTHCGKSLELKDVLFRMDYLLHWKQDNRDNALTNLNLYVTEEELRILLENGQQSREPGMTLCSVSFMDICKLLSNENNLNIPEFDLSFQDLCMFLDHSSTAEDQQLAAPKQGVKEDDEAFALREIAYQKAMEERKARHERYQRILAMIQRMAHGSDGANLNAKQKDEREEVLKTQLRSLRDIYGTKKKVDAKDGAQENTELTWEERPRYFLMSLWEEPSAQHDDVLLGYVVKAASEDGRGYGDSIDCRAHRVCPRCKELAFEGAGTAIHRMAMFVGSTGTGKTSTILAMAHFVRNQNKGIWLNKKLDVVKDIRLISAGAQLEADLENYGKGFAPAKTQRDKGESNGDSKAADENKKEMNFAYSATFEVKKNRTERSFLTFMDAPGEVCSEKTGKLEVGIVRDHFNAIITCDAYVLCFEDPVARDERSKTADKKDKPADEHKNMVIQWARDIQKLRSDMRRHYEQPGDYAPMMILFTKGRDIEEKDAQEMTARKGNNAVYYIYPEEVAAIRKKNDEWQEIMENLGADEQLRQAYFAQLRCSPFGYTSPKVNTADKVQLPSPKNVDKLLTWLLYATGLAPMDLSKEQLGTDNYMTPPENRRLLPDQKMVRDGGHEVPYTGAFLEKYRWCKEKPYMKAVSVAMLRGKLFTNIQSADRDYIRFKDDGIQMHKTWRKYHPKNNK